MRLLIEKAYIKKSNQADQNVPWNGNINIKNFINFISIDYFNSSLGTILTNEDSFVTPFFVEFTPSLNLCWIFASAMIFHFFSANVKTPICCFWSDKNLYISRECQTTCIKIWCVACFSRKCHNWSSLYWWKLDSRSVPYCALEVM